MRKKLKSKYCILIAIVIALGIFLININSKKPIIKFYLIKPNSSHVIFNNHSTEETLKKAKELVEEKGEIQKGYALYKFILKKDPTNVEAYMGMAYAYGKINNFEKAIEYIKQMEKYMNSSTPPEIAVNAYYIAGIIYSGTTMYEGTKYYEDAINAFQKALEVQGLKEDVKRRNDIYIYLRMGMLYLDGDIEDKKKAIECFLKSYENDKDDKTVFFSIALAYLDIEEYDKALEYIEKLENKPEQDNENLLLRARYYSEIGEYKKADDLFNSTNKKIDNQKDWIKYYSYHAIYYEKLKEYDKAKECYTKLIDISPYFVNEYNVEEAAKRLGMDLSKEKQEIEQEKEKAYSTSLD
ncbi:tetratricopeptide repeat protein [Sporanaerobacter acetigenes]|uniref:Pentatricopeptide repeat domain-containing protein (PPR motif) n=1 Tax=Sporanaerobacter acetigenes DSM 13106 TaxID=1123281 RepID=A0A1M5XC34_9FIRM|nr:tetratricopeptide repeat protein [Sporanaerobacter acetigenes]SHH97427.1 pentatricopeptide repeat domain-containing protein (PPR motif) [Sporanaerobacter acetigenes DSM 13106]